jgi:hypothetical protein
MVLENSFGGEHLISDSVRSIIMGNGVTPQIDSFRDVVPNSSLEPVEPSGPTDQPSKSPNKKDVEYGPDPDIAIEDPPVRIEGDDDDDDDGPGGPGPGDDDDDSGDDDDDDDDDDPDDDTCNGDDDDDDDTDDDE